MISRPVNQNLLNRFPGGISQHQPLRERRITPPRTVSVSPVSLEHQVLCPPAYQSSENLIDEEIPPYNASLHKYLDLISFDTRYAPVLRINRYMISDENKLKETIAKLHEHNVLPESVDLWEICHIDDAEYESLIPSLLDGQVPPSISNSSENDYFLALYLTLLENGIVAPLTNHGTSSFSSSELSPDFQTQRNNMLRQLAGHVETNPLLHLQLQLNRQNDRPGRRHRSSERRRRQDAEIRERLRIENELEGSRRETERQIQLDQERRELRRRQKHLEREARQRVRQQEREARQQERERETRRLEKERRRQERVKAKREREEREKAKEKERKEREEKERKEREERERKAEKERKEREEKERVKKEREEKQRQAERRESERKEKKDKERKERERKESNSDSDSHMEAVRNERFKEKEKRRLRREHNRRILENPPNETERLRAEAELVKDAERRRQIRLQRKDRSKVGKHNHTDPMDSSHPFRHANIPRSVYT